MAKKVKKTAKKPAAKKTVWKGNASLRQFLVPLRLLKRDPQNARRHSSKSVAGIRAALNEFGQQTPIVVDEKKVVRKGNGTLEAARKEGWTHLAALVTDIDDEGKVRLYALADNRTSEKSDWDLEFLSKNVQESAKTSRGFLATLWDDFELEPLLQARWEPPKIGEMPESQQMRMGESVKLTKEQRLTVDRAVANFKASENDPNLSDGYVIERICADWLS